MGRIAGVSRSEDHSAIVSKESGDISARSVYRMACEIRIYRKPVPVGGNMEALSVQKTQYKVRDFLSWQRDGSLVLTPRFQRRGVWNPRAKSYLIDTIVKGLPIPIIFLRDQTPKLGTIDHKREVVDGQQRLRTLISYIDSTFLRDYKPDRDEFQVMAIHNPELANRNFWELPAELRQRILDYEFSVHVLSSGVDDREVLSIFARMNSTGVKLNPQELRNAEYHGAFKTSMYRIALGQLPRWRGWRIFSDDGIARMQEVELTSEFALLMLDGLTGKSSGALNHLYEDKEDDFPEGEEVERRFNVIMDTIDDKLATGGWIKAFQRRALFYGLFTFLYEVQFGIGSLLQGTKVNPVPPEAVSGIKEAGQRMRDKSAPDAVLESITRRNTNVRERTVIFEYFKKMAGNA